MSDYKSLESVSINGHKYKWDDIMNGLYWSHINKYSKHTTKVQFS
jgi:hypothetical protein